MKVNTLPLASIVLTLLLSSCSSETSWQERTDQNLQLFGHRNWIVIADAAYPKQSAAGIETIQTGADHLEVLEFVLRSVKNAAHVTPVIMVDREMDFVPEEMVPGIESYRSELSAMLSEFEIKDMPHEDIIHKLDEASRYYNILILKTNLLLPYTSVFIELDCGYWSGSAEQALRGNMNEE